MWFLINEIKMACKTYGIEISIMYDANSTILTVYRGKESKSSLVPNDEPNYNIRFTYEFYRLCKELGIDILNNQGEK